MRKEQAGEGVRRLNSIERSKTAKKIAQLLAESGAKMTAVRLIFENVRKYLGVCVIPDDSSPAESRPDSGK